MKFMLRWKVHPEKRHEVLKSFAKMTAKDDAADRGKGIKMIGRWHDLAGFTGVAIAETDDANALASWVLNWNGVLDMEAIPVVDDAEARKIGRKKLA